MDRYTFRLIVVLLLSIITFGLPLVIGAILGFSGLERWLRRREERQEQKQEQKASAGLARLSPEVRRIWANRVGPFRYLSADEFVNAMVW
jgi:hypothetical protein